MKIDLRAMNERVIAGFRARGGQADGPPMLLLTTTGARSGQPHLTPLLYLPDGERQVVFAANGGAPEHPDWYRNLRTNPAVTVETGGETFPARATEIIGEERDRLFAAQAAMFGRLTEHQAKTGRPFPVIALTRA
ncbi:nitroreductase/quinone reductase family protein [Amycolatopsis sp. NPDC059027]|uniref:nitroreductase/quinone reductase family protein n=1 Tax=Amycolatopsis sp. NPDC059027 TaxID=3346709 RepID=UPI00367235E6